MEKTIQELKTQGKQCIQKKEYTQAITLFNQVIEKNPNDIYTLDLLGFLYYMTGRFEKAKSCCEKSITLKPDNYYAFKGLGLCLVRLKKVNEGMIPAEGSPTEGASYDFVDDGVKNRKTYSYKLEDVDLNGVTTEHGPVSATPRLINGIGKK